jgi:retron-type reverse transcriptase
MKPRLLQRAPESQGRLLPFLEHRTGDRRIILIQKWPQGGVLEESVVSNSDRGTGQGSVTAPLLAVCPHHILASARSL